MPTLTPAPCAYQTIEDANGMAIVGGKVNVRLAGLATLATTYSDAIGTPNTNPIIAGAGGRFVMFLTPGVTYDLDYTDADGAIFKTVSGVAATPSSANNLDVTGVAGENLAANTLAYLSDGSAGTAGKWYKADADFAYASTLPELGFTVSAILSGASGTLRQGGRLAGFSGLTVGSSYYASATAGAVTATAPVLQRFVGVADATDALILTLNPNVPNLTNVDVTGVAGEALSLGNAVYLSDGSGAKTAGRWYKADSTNTYSSTLPVVGWALAVIGSGSSGVFRLVGRVEQALGAFVAGSTYYLTTAGGLTTVAPANRRVFAVADSTTSLILVGDPPRQADAEYNAGNTGAALTIDFALNGALQKATRTANTTLTLTFPAYAGTFILKLVHEASATVYTVAFAATPKYVAGAAPVFTNTSGAIDILTFYWDGTTAFCAPTTAWA